MADLEDFFAKRDKSKKSKKKFDTSDDVAKVLEQKTKEKKKLETGKSNYLPEGGRQSPGPGLPAGDDDEWLEAEEKKPDFSNLKIQELVLDSDDDEEPGQEGQENADGANEGPWNKKKESKQKEGENDKEKEKEESEPKTQEDKDNVEEGKPEDAEREGDGEGDSSKEAEKQSGDTKYVPPSKRKTEEPSASVAANKPAYVPPALRGGGASSGATLSSMPKKKGAPTLDDESFPTLS